MMTGFIKDYVDYASESTDTPLDFLDLSAVITAGVVIGDKRYFQHGHNKLFPNLYMIIIAPSTFYRKSTALNISREMVRKIDPMKVYPEEFSQEKMSEILSENPVGIFYWYEWKSLMGMLSKDYMAGTKSWLTDIYDGFSKKKATLQRSHSIERPCPSILSATTSDWFLDSIKSGDIESGFLTRFLLIYSNKKIRNDALPPAPDQLKYQPLIDKLKEMSNLEEKEMVFSPEAKKSYIDWYNKFISTHSTIPDRIRTLFSRLDTNCIKLSIILQTCKNNGLLIENDTLKEAIQYCEYVKHSTLEMCHEKLYFTKMEEIEKRILKILKDKGKTSHAHIMQIGHIDAWHFKAAMNTLTEKEIVKLTKENVEKSKKITSFYELC